MSALAVIAFDVRCYDACRFTRGAGHPSGVPWRQAFDAWEWYFQLAAAVFGTVAATAALYLALRRQRGAAVFVASSLVLYAVWWGMLLIGRNL